MLDHFKDVQKMQEILHEAQTGLWVIELDEGKAPRMYADSAMLKLLGFEETPAPEVCYQYWYERIEEEYYPIVQAAVERIAKEDRAEVQYPWHHPKWGRIYVRCGGVRDLNYTDGICLRGYHQNITNTVMVKQEYDTIIDTLSQSYMGILLCNIQDCSYKMIKSWDEVLEFPSGIHNYEEFFGSYVKKEVASHYSCLIMDMIKSVNIMEKLSQGNRQIEALFRNKRGGWRRIRVVPLAAFSEDYPWVIVALDEQDGEMEKRIDEATAQVALSQIYRLVISLNLVKSEYNCIHYSGNLLHLNRHGSNEDFYKQIISKMPIEDQQELKRIFESENYEKNNYLEGVLRLYGPDGNLHYYDYYSVCILQDLEERILMTARNVDDKYESQIRENVLSNLCQCYYSIHLFDLEADKVETIWQEDSIQKQTDPSMGSLKQYFKHFIQNHVFLEDREKMRKAGDPAFLRSILSKEQPVYDIDFRRIYPHGLEWVRSRFSVAEMKGGQAFRVVFANMNIHEQKLKELEEGQQKKMALSAAYETAKKANEAKSNFLAQMSHDIRTPMNAITGMTAIAQKHLDNKIIVKDCLSKINLSSNHLLALINEILDMSVIEKGKIELTEEPFSIRDTMQEIRVIIRPEVLKKKQEFGCYFKDVRHDRLIGDVGRIRQVMINLISNAVKYTPIGGKISVSVQEFSVRAYGCGCFVFMVEDNGIGMSEDFLNHIFVPFSRADDLQVRQVQGTGLGMSIAQGIVSAMQGNIQVESTKGKGSRFTVTLNLKLDNTNLVTKQPPILADGSEEPLALEDGIGNEANALPLKVQRLLIVEDNKLNLEIAQTILQEAGFLIDGAENGCEALKTFVQSEPGTYQAILMDLQMPVMDGYTAARKIRASAHAQANDIPIIALTANAFAEDIAKALSAGMNDHVSKPVDYNHLIQILSKNIQSKVIPS